MDSYPELIAAYPDGIRRYPQMIAAYRDRLRLYPQLVDTYRRQLASPATPASGARP